MSIRSMRMTFLAWCAVSLCAVLSNSALAHVYSGGNCAACHGSETDRQDVKPGTLLPNLLAVTPRLDVGGNTASLKSFTVHPGGTATLSIEVLNGGTDIGDSYAVVLSGTRKGSPLSLESLATSSTVHGVKNSTSDLLSFTADPTWTLQPGPTTGTGTKADNKSKAYYTLGGDLGFAWDGTPKTYSFNLTVNPNTPIDVYSLTLRTSGLEYGTGAWWTQSEEVLLNVTPSAPVPEPAAIVLLLTAGVGSLLYLVRRKKK